MTNLRSIIIAGLIIIIAAFLFWYSLTIQDVFFEITDSLEQDILNNEILAIIIFIFLAALSAMFAPLSSIPLIPAAVLVWGDLITISILLLGWLIGGAITYIIGRWAAYSLLSHFLSMEKIDYYRQKLSSKSEFWLVFLFRLAMPAEIPGYVLGALKYHFGNYILITFLVELPTAIILIYASEALLLKERALFVGLVVAALAAISAFFYFFHKNLKNVH